MASSSSASSAKSTPGSLAPPLPPPLALLSRFLAPSSDKLTSAISRASAVRSAQTPKSATAEGARPAGALTAGSASTPAPTDEPTMSATAERTLLVDEEVEAGVEGEGEAATERRAAEESLPSSAPSPRCGLRSSSEGSRRFLERERERRCFVVFAFWGSLDADEEEAAATLKWWRCRDRDR